MPMSHQGITQVVHSQAGYNIYAILTVIIFMIFQSTLKMQRAMELQLIKGIILIQHQQETNFPIEEALKVIFGIIHHQYFIITMAVPNNHWIILRLMFFLQLQLMIIVAHLTMSQICQEVHFHQVQDYLYIPNTIMQKQHI